jgi:hypothetical protein
LAGNIKDDPIIRTLLIIIIGTIAFGLLFNIFIGGGSSMGEHYASNMSGSAFSIDVFLSGILILLVKLLLGVLVIAVIVGVVMWIKNAFFKNMSINTQILKPIHDDPILRTIAGITAAVLGIIIILALLHGFLMPSMGYGMGYSMNGNMGYGMGYSMNGGMGYGMGGLNPILSVAGLLGLLIKVLSFVLVVSLILAVVAYLKKQYDQGVFSSPRTASNAVKSSESINVPILINEDNTEE